MTTGNISSGDMMAVMLNAKTQNSIISSGTQVTESFQSIFGQNRGDADVNSAMEMVNDTDSIETAFDKSKANKTKEILKADEAADAGINDEAYSKLSENIKDVVKEELGISEEELSKAMAELGLTFADLLSPQNVAKLVAHVENVEPAAIIIDGNLTEHLTEIVNAINDMVQTIAEELQIPVEDVAKEFESYLAEGENVESEMVTEQPVTTVINDEETGKEITVTMEGNRVTETTTETTETMGNVDNQNQTMDKDNSADSSASGEQNNSSDMFAGSLLNNLTDSIQNSAGIQGDFSQIYNANATDIINQLIDSIKVNVTADTSSMELQLTPENLGKINLTVVAKDGQITASITAQNDLVKAVIESQLIQLKETLANQGLKVTDVEVTVANQEFNRNFDDNNGNAKEQKSNAHKKFRGIDELSDAGSDFEESVIDRIIESEGSSVNFRA